jgi:hypothetical protein
MHLPEILPHWGTQTVSKKGMTSPLPIQKHCCQVTLLKFPLSVTSSSFSEGLYQHQYLTEILVLRNAFLSPGWNCVISWGGNQRYYQTQI